MSHKCVLSKLLNPEIDSDCRIVKGSLFQSTGAATSNERSPNDLVLDFGTESSASEDDLVANPIDR